MNELKLQMTDKEQVIVDGVDVSKCKYSYHEFLTNKVKCSLNDFFHCESSHPCEGENCFFKQLARKTQVIDEIKEVIKPYQEQIELDALSLPSAIESILERKTQECEELKEKLETYKGIFNERK